MPAPVKRAIRSALTLGALMAGAGLLLALLNAATAERIDGNRRAARQAMLLEAAGVAVDMPAHADVIDCAAGLTALALVERGYGGAMEVVAAFRAGGLAGIRVTRHAETPGFADILAPAGWIGRLGGGAGAIDEAAALDAATGATITAGAVLRARRAAWKRYAEGAPQCPS